MLGYNLSPFERQCFYFVFETKTLRRIYMNPKGFKFYFFIREGMSSVLTAMNAVIIIIVNVGFCKAKFCKSSLQHHFAWQPRVIIVRSTFVSFVV